MSSESEMSDHAENERGDHDGQAVLTRQGYRKLMDDIVDNEDNMIETENNHHVLLQYLQNNDELYDNVEAPQEAVMDAHVVKHLSRLCRKQAEQMSTNINVFKAEEYAEKLKASMNVEQSLDKRKWILLGEQVKTMFRRTPPLTFMFGSLDTSPPEPKEKKQREMKAKQATKLSQLKETQAAVMTETEKSVSQTDQMVSHVFKCLVLKWKENDKRPLNYFKFVINPKCFGTSVENIFHVSFLVKEGKVGITLDSGLGYPVIEPVSKQKVAESQHDDLPRNQVVMSICMKDWSNLIKKHSIRETMIARIKT